MEDKKDIPHGHGRSFKRGIADSLLGSKTNGIPRDLPNGHEETYRRGRSEGEELVKQIAERVRD